MHGWLFAVRATILKNTPIVVFVAAVVASSPPNHPVNNSTVEERAVVGSTGSRRGRTRSEHEVWVKCMVREEQQ